MRDKAELLRREIARRRALVEPAAVHVSEVLGDLTVYDCRRTCTECGQEYAAKTFDAGSDGKHLGRSGVCNPCGEKQDAEAVRPVPPETPTLERPKRVEIPE